MTILCLYRISLFLEDSSRNAKMIHIHESTSITHHINKMKDKYHRIICKCMESIQQNFSFIHDKNCNKVGIEGTYLNMVKAMYNKPRAKFILSGEKLKMFPLRSGARQRCPLLPLLFNIILEVLVTTIK